MVKTYHPNIDFCNVVLHVKIAFHFEYIGFFQLIDQNIYLFVLVEKCKSCNAIKYQGLRLK